MNSRCRHEKYEKEFLSIIYLHSAYIYFAYFQYFSFTCCFFLHSLSRADLENSWIFNGFVLMNSFYSFIPGCFRSRGRNFHHLLPSHRLKFHSSLCRLRYWSKLKYLKKILGFADLKHFIMLSGKEIIFKLFTFS